MARIITRGKDVIEVVERHTGLVGEDTQKLIKVVMEEVVPMILRVDRRMSVIESKIEDTFDVVTETNAFVGDSKVKSYIGKEPEFLPSAMDKVKKLDHKEIRRLIYRAAGNQKSGYNKIYTKLSDITGINIYEAGKSRITKKDGLGFTNPGTTYINTLFLKGVEYKAAAIALDIIHNK